MISVVVACCSCRWHNKYPESISSARQARTEARLHAAERKHDVLVVDGYTVLYYLWRSGRVHVETRGNAAPQQRRPR